MAKYLIGIDEGTTGTKVCVFDTEGHLVSSAYEEYPSYYPKPGYVEQDVAQITDAFFSVCKKAVKKAKVDPADILAVSLSSQGAAMVLLDENGSVVRNRMIGWQDLRNIEVHDEKGLCGKGSHLRVKVNSKAMKDKGAAKAQA